MKVYSCVAETSERQYSGHNTPLDHGHSSVASQHSQIPTAYNDHHHNDITNQHNYYPVRQHLNYKDT